MVLTNVTTKLWMSCFLLGGERGRGERGGERGEGRGKSERKGLEKGRMEREGKAILYRIVMHNIN